MIISLVFILFTSGLLIAGNYFYSQSVKRGEEIELYSGTEAVEVFSNQQNQVIIEKAQGWYDNQKFEVIEQVSYDGLLLKAKYLRNSQKTKKAVILAHGYRGFNDQMGDLVKFYYDLGFDILMPDARGHGESQGDYIGYGWHDRLDYLSWIDELTDKRQADTIFLHGNSMGASLVLMTSGEDLPTEVKGIIADSGYTSVKDELVYQLKHLYNLPPFPLMQITSVITDIRAGYNFKEASAIKQVKKNTRPLFIIHGDKDELVPTEMAHEIFAAATSEKEFWIVPDAGHTKAYEVATSEYQKRLEDFIDRTLSR
ncbi:alpha/beta hydrolase [Aquibacillus saliphilus]|uniref:alpha/beta hydrolase n=1 Tax=Aquibacillus saliphilus TaxID=1909422 RepID=UPI001CF0C728|nr:alpha/beta hydrolase [Aquibacillus saliphilus]